MKTYEEVARILCVSRTRVLKIEKRALEKLRIALEKQGVTLADVRALPAAPDFVSPLQDRLQDTPQTR